MERYISPETFGPKSNKKAKIIFVVSVFLVVVISVIAFFVLRKNQNIVQDVPVFSFNADLGSKEILVPADFPFISEGTEVKSLESYNENSGLHTYTAQWSSDLSAEDIYNRFYNYATTQGWDVLPGIGTGTFYIQAGKDHRSFVAFITGSQGEKSFVELTFHQTRVLTQ